MVKFLITILSIVLLNGCVMDYVDTITVNNKSKFKVDVLINENYPDTTIAKTELIKIGINPAEEGPLDLVNKKWKEYLKRKGKVTLFFVDHKSYEFYKSGRKEPQKVYGKLILSQAKLDSLGGEIVFPDDVIKQ